MSRSSDRVVAAGFNGYVSKPIDVSTFGEMVDEHVAGEAQA